MRFTLFGMLGILLWGIALDGAEKNTTIGNPYGICAHLNRWEYKQLSQELELMKKAGIGNVRTDLDWNQLEAEKGKWNFERWDAIVAEAEKNGIAVVETDDGMQEFAAVDGLCDGDVVEIADGVIVAIDRAEAEARRARMQARLDRMLKKKKT